MRSPQSGGESAVAYPWVESAPDPTRSARLSKARVFWMLEQFAAIGGNSTVSHRCALRSNLHDRRAARYGRLGRPA